MRESIVHFYTPQTKTPFYLEMAGISYCDGSYIMRRKCSTETVFEYIVEGHGYLTVDGVEYTASEGDVYILRQKTAHTYWSDAKKPWTKIFFNIRGSFAEKVLAEYGLGENIVISGCDIEENFRKMLDVVSDYTIPQSDRFDKASIMFLETIIKLSKYQKLSDSHRLSGGKQEEMNKLIEYIAMNPRRIVSNEELADVIFRSKDYCIKKFAHHFGVTPYEYQIQQKIFTAQNLLKNTQMSIKEIASTIGYEDQHYFSYMFKKRCGQSPLQYRKNLADRYPTE
ncbi:MAG: helix-turn-helix transcriptional regulator [Clostridia bacterium]|nr:helix-turn-helix transcriptional regulator [Clostridia bacterium]